MRSLGGSDVCEGTVFTSPEDNTIRDESACSLTASQDSQRSDNIFTYIN